MGIKFEMEYDGIEEPTIPEWLKNPIKKTIWGNILFKNFIFGKSIYYIKETIKIFFDNLIWKLKQTKEIWF